MDRLIIEATLADVNEILVSDLQGEQEPAIVLAYSISDTDKVKHAWSAFRNIADKHGTDLLICKTMVSGIYDLEIKTPELDEPVRILNKVISNETLTSIQQLLNENRQIGLGIDPSADSDRIPLSAIHIKECMPRH